MFLSHKIFMGTAAAMLAICAGLPAAATQLTYTPTIPAFGGNPNNYSYLIGTAQIQNDYTGSSGGSSGAPTINFPPISVNLGGIGGSGATQPAGTAINPTTGN